MSSGEYEYGVRHYVYEHGVTIKISNGYGLSKAVIYVPNPPPVPTENVKYKCYPGYPCFIFGIIDEVLPGSAECDTEYAISLCLRGYFKPLTGYTIQASDWAKYEVGQYVLLGPPSYLSEAPKCCSDDTFLRSWLLIPKDNNTKLIPGRLAIYPIHLFEGMVKHEPKEI
jgi:hypothetical protein